VIDSSTPQRHQHRHHPTSSPPVPAVAARLSRKPSIQPSAHSSSSHPRKEFALGSHHRPMSLLEKKFRAMEVELLQENVQRKANERKKNQKGASSEAPSTKIPAFRPPRLSITQRTRAIRPPESVLRVDPGSGLAFPRGSSSATPSRSFPPAPRLPERSPEGLPMEYGPMKQKERGDREIRALRKPKQMAGPRPASAKSSAGRAAQPYSDAFENLQMQHENLQPSPSHAGRSILSPRAASAAAASHSRHVQFQRGSTPQQQQHAAIVPRIPSPPSSDSGSQVSQRLEMDPLLQQVEAHLAQRANVLQQARQTEPMHEFISPSRAHTAPADVWPSAAAYDSVYDTKVSYPVTESQLAQVALDYLNAAPPSKGGMSRSLLQQQLLAIGSMLQQPHDAIQQSVRQMQSQEAVMAAGTGVRPTPPQQTYRWEENLSF
jgi:hypothetical protein